MRLTLKGIKFPLVAFFVRSDQEKISLRTSRKSNFAGLILIGVAEGHKIILHQIQFIEPSPLYASSRRLTAELCSL